MKHKDFALSDCSVDELDEFYQWNNDASHGLLDKPVADDDVQIKCTKSYDKHNKGDTYWVAAKYAGYWLNGLWMYVQGCKRSDIIYYHGEVLGYLPYPPS